MSDNDHSNAHIPVVTVDGPSGVGKGTIGQMLARELAWHFLDSGALYRILVIAARKHSVALDNAQALEVLGEYMDVQFILPEMSSASPRILFEGEEVSLDIRTEECGISASHIAVIPEVRRGLIGRQRQFKEPPGLVADGRDMGTVVFPEAEVKFFLTATPQERANRRYKQLKEKGIDVNLDKLLEEIKRRDDRDVNRAVSPLKSAVDAIQIDTTNLDIQQVFAKVMAHVKQRLAVTN